MQSDAQQAAFRREVNAQIQHCAMHRAIYNSLHFTGVFLEHQEIVRAKKRHAYRGD